MAWVAGVVLFALVVAYVLWRDSYRVALYVLPTRSDLSQEALPTNNQLDSVVAVEGSRRAMDPNTLIAAHRHSANHRPEVGSSKECGCFYCLTVFPPAAISEWCDEESTALCPKCGVDSVIGDASGYSIDEGFLRRMRDYWF